MGSKNIEMPFFPHYETELLGNGDANFRITWFESKFSQSHYNIYNKTIGSNACTLIAILLASKCQKYNVIIKGPQDNLNIRLIHLLAISMLEGNKIHEELKSNQVLKHLNLNVPEALKYTETHTYNLVEWRSSIYMERLSRSLHENIKNNYSEWVKLDKAPKENLYVILIADARTVLFIFQRKTNTVRVYGLIPHFSQDMPTKFE
ncbi:unnamed protein product [Ceutorhynchus assimilis]|uniref:Uncharacterized protein n=1 Tax=Ceutorhynchus assimilis TaxID=467358 RepID=A0A9P0GKQ0_9CUCU|nr:unnamed protein product [Ceutorhynchus assimilis]